MDDMRGMKRRRESPWAWAALLLALLGFSLAQAQGGGFRFRGLLNRLVTPNGDTFNDRAIFCLDNPSASGVEAKIYSLFGSEVASLGAPSAASATSCPQDSVVSQGPQYVTWDGRSQGSVVHSGIYVYRIKSEGMTYSGTLVVVR